MYTREDLFGATAAPIYTSEMLTTHFDGGNSRISIFYLSWVWFYVRALAHNDTYLQLREKDNNFIPWNLPAEACSEWFPKYGESTSTQGRMMWRLCMDYWYKAIFQNPLYIVLRTADMGLGLFARVSFQLHQLTKDLNGFLECFDIDEDEEWAGRIASRFEAFENRYILYGPLSLLNHSTESILAFNNLNRNGTTAQNIVVKGLNKHWVVEEVEDMVISYETSTEYLQVEELMNDGRDGNTQEECATVHQAEDAYRSICNSYYALRLIVVRPDSRINANNQILVKYDEALKLLIRRSEWKDRPRKRYTGPDSPSNN
jgi:hypothetical protein